MDKLSELLSYLEGNAVNQEFVEVMKIRAKQSCKTLYRTILLGEAKIGELVDLSEFQICSASSTANASLKASISFADDTDKDTKGKLFVTCAIHKPFVCLSFDVILRYLEYFNNYGYTKNIVIPRLIKEQEYIILNNCKGEVICVEESY